MCKIKIERDEGKKNSIAKHKISHIRARHTQKKNNSISNVKMKLCGMNFVHLQMHVVEQECMIKMHLIQLSHPNNCVPCVHRKQTKNLRTHTRIETIYLFELFKLEKKIKAH